MLFFLFFWFKKESNKFISSTFERKHLKEKFVYLHIKTSQFHNFFCVCFLPFIIFFQVCLQPSENYRQHNSTTHAHINFHFLWHWTSTSEFILFFPHNIARVIDTISFPFRQKLKSLQNESLNIKYQLYSLNTCSTSNFNEFKGLSGKQALNKSMYILKVYSIHYTLT